MWSTFMLVVKQYIQQCHPEGFHGGYGALLYMYGMYAVVIQSYDSFIN